ncbi:MAG: CRISPR-associated CARF protein Csx1, partial [Campylobacterales bacterium]
MGEGKIFKLLIAPLGNPKLYQKVTYYFEVDGKTIEKESPITIPVLEEGLNPDRTIILVPDSAGIEGEKWSREMEEKGVKGIYPVLVEEGLSLAKGRFQEVEGAEERGNRLFFPLSNRGRFKSFTTSQVFHFEGGAQDYYYDFLYKLTHQILPPQELAEYEGLEIYLDITHGINFMPIFIYRGLLTATSLLAFLKPGKVKIKVFNTDPFVKDVTKILKIHQIEERVITPAPLNRQLKKASLLKPVSIPPEERGKFFKEVKPRTDSHSYEQDLNSFIGSFYYGFPLVATTFFPPVEEMEGHLKEMYRVYWENITEKEKKGEIVIDKRVHFTPAFELVTLASWQSQLVGSELGLSKCGEEGVEVQQLKKIGQVFGNNSVFINNELNDLEERGQFAEENWECYNRIMERTERINGKVMEISRGEGEFDELKKGLLKQLEELKKGIGKVGEFLKKEVGGLEELEKLGRLIEKQKLPPLSSGEEKREQLLCGKEPGINPRNFRAHAGLERNSVEVRRSKEGKVMVRYAPVRSEKIKEVASKDL